MTTTMGTLRYGIDTYAEWLGGEGIPVHEGISLDLFEVKTEPWARVGVKGAFTKFVGGGDFCSMFVLDIPAGGSTLPQRHLAEEIYFVLEGRGSTQIELNDGSKRSFEWGPRSFFAIPLNAKYRHFNGSGTQRALMCATTTLPVMLRLFHDDKFVFDTPYEFGSRIGTEKFYAGEGNLHLVRAGNNMWETNFIPDLNAIELLPWEERGAGSTSIIFALADGIMHAHISEIAPATYKKAHRHNAGTHVLTLSGDGYSLLWYEGQKDFTRVDWKYGVVFPPCAGQFHQHFVTSNHASRYVATNIGGMRYPLLEEHRRIALGSKPGEIGAVQRSVKDGGDQLEYEDQDPRIHQIWLDEMKKAGITPKLEWPPKKK
jgi:quercetin dioxygenase-like cupin family protein